jgi:predicted NUDIX family NTP pyrophosphohydrolase
MAGDLDATPIESVTCEVEWPPKGGRLIRVPEVNCATPLIQKQTRNQDPW